MPTDFPYTHPRADWVNPLEPVSGPAPFPWVTADRVALHYTAALNLIDGDPGEDWAGIPAYLRAIHHDYLTNPARGYSIGYGIAVDQRGVTWQLRGVTWKNAANLNWNHRTLAVLVLVDAADELRPPAVDAVRKIVAWFRSQSPFAAGVKIVGHRDIGATACPGNGVYSQITAGVLEPLPKPPPPDGDDMPAVFWKDERYHDVFQTSPSVHYCDGSDLKVDADVRTGRHHRKLRSLAIQCGITSVSKIDWSKVPVNQLPDEPN